MNRMRKPLLVFSETREWVFKVLGNVRNETDEREAGRLSELAVGWAKKNASELYFHRASLD